MQTKPLPFQPLPFDLYSEVLFAEYQQAAKRLGLPKEVPDSIVQAVKHHVATTPQTKITLRSCMLALDFAIALYSTKTF